MTDNVIYGIDFRAGKEEAPLCNAPDVFERVEAKLDHLASEVRECVDILDSKGWHAPDGDCA